jgi:hypothetical protein
MQLQLLSDLHLETESFDPVPAPQAELLVLAGDVDSTWAGYSALPAGRCRCSWWPATTNSTAATSTPPARAFAICLPGWASRCWNANRTIHTAADGRHIRLARHHALERLSTSSAPPKAAPCARPSTSAPDGRPRRHGRPFDAAAVREDTAWPAAAWLEARSCNVRHRGRWDKTVVITHFGPACAAPTRVMAASPARPASATPTTT